MVRIGLLLLGYFTFFLPQVEPASHVSGINKVYDLLEASEGVCKFCEELGLRGNGLVLIVTNFKFFPFQKFSFTIFIRFFNIIGKKISTAYLFFFALAMLRSFNAFLLKGIVSFLLDCCFAFIEVRLNLCNRLLLLLKPLVCQ